MKSALLALTVLAVTAVAGLPHEGTPDVVDQASLNQRIKSLEAEVQALKEELAENSVLALDGYVRLITKDPARPTVRVAGANLQIVNGAGSRSVDPNGLGNLIVGYDRGFDPRESDKRICSLGGYANRDDCLAAGGVWAMQHKSGSHNIVVGPGHRYSQAFGIVSGANNSINNEAASVVGARYSLASGRHAVVLGGSSHRATGNTAAVLGGWDNEASGPAAKVSGGVHNSATAQGAAVSGGNWSLASGMNASVSGGSYNTASGNQSSVSGGWLNTATGIAAGVSGGYGNVAAGDYATVGGGHERTAAGEYDWVAGELLEDE